MVAEYSSFAGLAAPTVEMQVIWHGVGWSLIFDYKVSLLACGP